MSVRKEQLSDNVTVICGDNREILPTVGRFDACVTDPPYGIARVWKGGFGRGWAKAAADTAERNEWDAEAPSAEFFQTLFEMTKQQIIWGGNYFDLRLSRGWLVWNKPERNFTLAEAELAWTNVDTVIRVCDAPRSEPGRLHPTQKPVAVMEWSISRLPHAGSVIDPFLGSGTTGVAAVRAGRAFTGIEREPKWFDLSCKRISDELRRPRLFAEPVAKPVQEALL